MWIADKWTDYELLDASDGERLERWGRYILRRPDPQIIWNGMKESREWNTADFTLQYKVNEGDEWQIADTVAGNTENTTLREFAPVNARYVRLHITKPTQNDRDKHCRIYQLHVYKCK